MSEIKVTEDQIKHLLKDAVAEVLEERRDLLREIMGEALDDLGLVRAIEEGMRSKNGQRKIVAQELIPGKADEMLIMGRNK